MYSEQLKIAENNTQQNITQSQAFSGDYQRGLFQYNDLQIEIENPKGSIRKGVDSDGVEWENKMHFTYGFFLNSLGVDGDEVDVFIGPDIDTDFDIYIINQIDCNTKLFDEQKVMFGFKNQQTAVDSYHQCYQSDWQGFSSVFSMKMSQFEYWIKSTKKPVNNQVKSQKNEVDMKDRVKVIVLEGEILEGITQSDLQKQAGDLSQFDTLVVEIASPGGSVFEGILIMIWFDMLSKMNKQVVTLITANAYSIASLIALSANLRLISKTADIMVHNPSLPNLEFVGAQQLEEEALRLRELEALMYEMYQIFTGLSKEEIKQLMDNETYIDAESAKRLGFVDEIINNIPSRPKSKVTNIKKMTNMKSTLNLLNSVIAKVTGANVVNQTYYNDEGGAIEIYQADPTTFVEGDRTNVESGTFKLSDGTTIVVENYLIKTIDKETITQAVDPAVVADPAVIAVDPAMPVDPAVAVDPAVDPTIVAVDPVMPVDPAVAVDPAVDPAKMIDANVGPAPKMAEIPNEDFVKLQELVGSLSETVKKLAEQLSDSNKSNEEFEMLATRAISALADETTSAFKPEARVRQADAPKGSIFEQMKQRNGIK